MVTLKNQKQLNFNSQVDEFKFNNLKIICFTPSPA